MLPDIRLSSLLMLLRNHTGFAAEDTVLFPYIFNAKAYGLVEGDDARPTLFPSVLKGLNIWWWVVAGAGGFRGKQPV